MILSNRTRLVFFFLSIPFLVFSLTGCSPAGCDRIRSIAGSLSSGPSANPAGGGGGAGPLNLGGNDVAAWEIWFETNGQRDSQPAVGVPGNLVLDVINSFPDPVTIHIQWIENNNLLFEDNYIIPVGESAVQAGWMFSTEGERTIMGKIRLVDPPVAEEPANNQASTTIWPQAPGANPPPGGGGGQPVQGVDLTWAQVIMTDVAGNNDVREPVAGTPVNIYAVSMNNGDTTAQNIARSLSIDNQSAGNDSVAQCAPGQCAFFVTNNYTFSQAGPHELTFAMTGFTPRQAANARGTNPLTITVNVLPAGANPPPGGGNEQTQGVDLTWADLVMVDAAGREVREPVVAGTTVKIVAASLNRGDTAAQNISRFLNIDGQGVKNDNVAQCSPHEVVPLIAEHYTFRRAGAIPLSLSMTGYTPARAANAQGTPQTTITIHVREAMTPVVGTPSLTVNTDEDHDLKFGHWVGYFQYGTENDPVGNDDPSSIYPGMQGDFRGTIANDTNYNEGNVGVSVKVDGQTIPGGDFTIERIPANDDGWFDIPYIFPRPGSYQVTYDIDPQNRIRETNENNNHKEIIVNVSNQSLRGHTKDLVCLNIQFGNDPHPLLMEGVTETTVGHKGSLVGTFYNLDRSPVDAYATILVDGRPVGPAQRVTERYFPAFASVNDYAFQTPGIHKMKLIVMALPGVGDSDSGNNSIERDIKVLPLPRIVGPIRPVLPDVPLTPTAPPPNPENYMSPCDLEAGMPTFWAQPRRNIGNIGNVGESGYVEYKATNNLPQGHHVLARVVTKVTKPNGGAPFIVFRDINVPPDQNGITDRVDLPVLTEPGTYEMSVMIDPPTFRINDSDRSNNEEHHGFTIMENRVTTGTAESALTSTPAPAPVPSTPLVDMRTIAPDYDLVADDISFWVHGVNHSVSRIGVGQRGWVRYTVRNRKGKPVDAVHSEVHFVLDGQIVQIIPAGLDIPSSGKATGKNDVAPFMTPGMYKMALVVDPLNRKKETHRNDNVLTRSLQVDAYQPPVATTPQDTGTSDSGGSVFGDLLGGLVQTAVGGNFIPHSSGSDSGSSYTPPSTSAPTSSTTTTTTKTPPRFTVKTQS